MIVTTAVTVPAMVAGAVALWYWRKCTYRPQHASMGPLIVPGRTPLPPPEPARLSRPRISVGATVPNVYLGGSWTPEEGFRRNPYHEFVSAYPASVKLALNTQYGRARIWFDNEDAPMHAWLHSLGWE